MGVSIPIFVKWNQFQMNCLALTSFLSTGSGQKYWMITAL